MRPSRFLAPFAFAVLALPHPPAAAAVDASARAARIRGFANQWIGTTYQWGGDSRAGIDCSAFLRRMYRELFSVELPRTTSQQIDLGLDLPLDPRAIWEGLEPGDLIFYIDRQGVPNHVVAYMGSQMVTHSVSGRGVVIDPIRQVFGRRIVARRLLVPASGGGGDFGPIPPAGPIVPLEIPCPPSIRADQREVRRFTAKPLPPIRELGDRDICDFRALAEALEKRGGPAAKENAHKLTIHSEWLESIEALKGSIGRGW